MKTAPAIKIVSSGATPRLTYVAKFLSENVLGSGVGIVPDQAGKEVHELIEAGHVVIYYGHEPMEGTFSIFSTGLTQEQGVRPHVPTAAITNRQTILFPAPDGFDLPFDLFSAVFYLLSRYEEYLPHQKDRHGRFEANQSHAFQNGYLMEPVIDQWLVMLKEALKKKYPALDFPSRKFRFVSTIDIDNPWAILNRGILRTAGSLLKALFKMNFREWQYRIRVLKQKQPDPFDTYGYILKLERQYGFSSLFFFLMGNYGKNDTNYAIDSFPFKKLLNSLKSSRLIGIHPSYKSNQRPNILKSEFERFAGLLGTKPEISRQHFLLLNIPETLRKLISHNVQTDYSMGYATHVGFRAGTSHPFRFYDLISEEETSLLLHPFIVMDVTLRQYMGLNPDQARERIIMLIEKVKATGGIFTSLWHNESLSEYGEWKGWQEVFENMVQEATGH
ncbi:MAG: polysaccharide deacetylase family protein [Bacteroidales bacterium]|nr:polysaccharide deacetylase family protein [Bacteroidales bacterium]